MKVMQWLSFFTIITVLFIRGFWPSTFSIDTYSIGLLFLLAIPLIAPFLKKAKWFGAEFIFKDEIQKLGTLVLTSENQAREAIKRGARQTAGLETFSTNTARRFLEIDPNISLAALRIEIERVLSLAAAKLFDEDRRKTGSISSYIAELTKRRIISSEQGDALKTIVTICNEAVHGAEVPEEQAEEIISLAERLNNSFPVGYSINFNRNERFSEQGLVCEWEHCIEHFPVPEESDEETCPVFGHQCPGGIFVKKSCDKTIDDIPTDRFIGNEN